MALSAPAIELLLRHEGGLVDDPDDPGGLTNFGISHRVYPDVDIRNLTREGAAEIYLRDYWRFDAIPSQALGNCVLDSAVNQGLGTAIRLFQALAHVNQDGLWGPGTEAAAYKVPLREFQIARLLRYVQTVAKNPAELKDLGGWFRRTLDV